MCLIVPFKKIGSESIIGMTALVEFVRNGQVFAREFVDASFSFKRPLVPGGQADAVETIGLFEMTQDDYDSTLVTWTFLQLESGRTFGDALRLQTPQKPFSAESIRRSNEQMIGGLLNVAEMRDTGTKK